MSQSEYTSGYKHGFTDALRDLSEAREAGEVPPEFLEQQKGNDEDEDEKDDDEE